MFTKKMVNFQRDDREKLTSNFDDFVTCDESLETCGVLSTDEICEDTAAVTHSGDGVDTVPLLQCNIFKQDCDMRCLSYFLRVWM